MFGYATSELNATTTTMEMRKQGKQTMCRTLFGMFPGMVNIVKLDLNLNTNAIITYFNKNLLDSRFINGYPLLSEIPIERLIGTRAVLPQTQ